MIGEISGAGGMRCPYREFERAGWTLSDWNPVSVEQTINETVNEIAQGVNTASSAYDAYLTADREFDLAYARAYMRCDGPAHAKKYQAELDTEAERIARDAADVAYKLADKTNKALEQKLDAIRSIGVSVRQAYQVAGRGEW